MKQEDLEMLFRLNAQARHMTDKDMQDPGNRLMLDTLKDLKAELIKTVKAEPEKKVEMTPELAMKDIGEAVSAFLHIPQIPKSRKPEEYVEAFNFILKVVEEKLEPKKSE